MVNVGKVEGISFGRAVVDTAGQVRFPAFRLPNLCSHFLTMTPQIMLALETKAAAEKPAKDSPPEESEYVNYYNRAKDDSEPQPEYVGRPIMKLPSKGISEKTIADMKEVISELYKMDRYQPYVDMNGQVTVDRAVTCGDSVDTRTGKWFNIPV